MIERLVERARAEGLDTAWSEEKRGRLAAIFDEELSGAGLPWDARQALFGRFVMRLLGYEYAHRYGPLQPLIDDPQITDIMVNGPNDVVVTGELGAMPGVVTFPELASWINVMVPGDAPLREVVLDDGVRAAVAMNATPGPSLVLSKPRVVHHSLDDLIKAGLLTAQVAEFLRVSVWAGLNILVIEPVPDHAPALLNALAMLPDEDTRVVAVERTARLSLPNAIRLPAGADYAAVLAHLPSLLPDRAVAEGVPTGALPSLLGLPVLASTLAESARDVVNLIEAPPWHIADAFDFVVTLNRLGAGESSVTRVTEIHGVEGSVVLLNDIFEFEQTGYENGRVIGRLRPTGLRPRKMQRILDAGINLPPSIFGIGGARQNATPPSQSTQEIPSAEQVQFTAVHPQEAAAETWYTFLTYAHLESLREAVQEDASRFQDEMGAAVQVSRSRTKPGLRRGSDLRFVPQAEGVTFKPAMANITWDDDIERVQFRCKADSYLVDGPAIGEVLVYTGPVELARIPFAIYIGAPGADKASPENPLAAAKIEAATAHMYQRIFVSYSHEDEDIAKLYRRAQSAAGQEVFVDSESLRSGDNWQAALAHAIDAADVFQLFWSAASAASDHVRAEWDYALNHRCGDDDCAGFIRPVYWQQPLPDPPEELSHLHFRYVPFMEP